MSAPWEDFGSQVTPQSDGPWNDFKSQTPGQPNPSTPEGPDIGPFKLQGSNPATMALSAAGQTFGVQPTDASTPQGAALQTVQNQALAPARLSNTIGAGGPVAGQAAQNLMKQAGTNPFMQGAANLVASTAADPRSYVMPGGDEAPVQVVPKNLPGAKIGEALSGTPASNLNRAYQGGFAKTYLNPQPLGEASDQYGKALNDVLTKHLTPEQRAAMLINPTGQANQKIADVYTQWLKNEPISAQDAVGAKTAISAVYPTNTAKNASKIAKLNEFESHLDGIIGQDAPAFSDATKNYAGSKLRSDLSMPLRVNKNNPQEYSKLGAMLLEGAGSLGSAGAHSIMPLVGTTAAAVATSPLALGIGASGLGTAAQYIQALANQPSARAALVNAFLRKYQANNPSPPDSSNPNQGYSGGQH